MKEKIDFKGASFYAFSAARNTWWYLGTCYQSSAERAAAGQPIRLFTAPPSPVQYEVSDLREPLIGTHGIGMYYAVWQHFGSSAM